MRKVSAEYLVLRSARLRLRTEKPEIYRYERLVPPV